MGGTLPIAEGWWDTSKAECERSARVGVFPSATISGNRFSYAQETATLSPVRDLGGGRFLLGQGNEEILIKTSGPKAIKFVRGGYMWGAGETLVWCSLGWPVPEEEEE